MFCGPLWMRRRSAAGSSASAVWSYLASSGPKHRVQTYWAVSSYSAPHSRQARLVTAMVELLVFADEPCVAKVASTATRLQELAPSRTNAGVAGASSGQSLHPSGRVQ